MGVKYLGLIDGPDNLVTKEYVDKKSDEIKTAREITNYNTSDPRPVKIWVGTQTEYDEQKDSITSDTLVFIKE